MNAGKIKYDNIEVPAELESVINGAIRRGEKRGRMRALKRALGCAAAVVIVLFAGANITPVYSYASDIPVLGSIVRVLHIGSGGEVTDGAQTGAEAEGDSVELTFTNGGSEMGSVPRYTVDHLLAPNRIVLRLHGVRVVNFQAVREALMSSEAVQDVYRNMILDDSAAAFTIVLKGGWDFEVAEYEDPGTLLFNFFPGGESAESEVYYLRTEGMDYSESLGHLCEKYHSEPVSQVKTLSGSYIVTIGQYSSREEAKAALEALNEKYDEEGVFYFASGAADATPER